LDREKEVKEKINHFYRSKQLVLDNMHIKNNEFNI